MATNMSRLGKWLINGLTVVTLCVALWVLLQPESLIRVRWEEYRSRVRSLRELAGHWDQLDSLAVPLYQGDRRPQVVEIANYNCHFCRMFSASVDSADDHGVRIAVLLTATPDDSIARLAALAVLCADSRSSMIRMHRRLMTSTTWRDNAHWAREALDAGIKDTTEFRTCMLRRPTARRFERNRELVESLSLKGTPTFLTKRNIVFGGIGADRLQAIASDQ